MERTFETGDVEAVESQQASATSQLQPIARIKTCYLLAKNPGTEIPNGALRVRGLKKKGLLCPQVGSKTFLATILILPVFCKASRVSIVCVKYFRSDLFSEDLKPDSFCIPSLYKPPMTYKVMGIRDDRLEVPTYIRFYRSNGSIKGEDARKPECSHQITNPTQSLLLCC